MTRQPGEEPMPIHFESRDYLRHLAEMFDEEMPGGIECSRFPSLLTVCCTDTLRKIPAFLTVSTFDKEHLK
jgi:hypothetical protein